jgi:hypothetical protein
MASEQEMAEGALAAAAPSGTPCIIHDITGKVDRAIMKDRMALALNILIDTDYMEVINALTSQIPGTDLLKVNCAGSSMFALGLFNAELYAEETQKLQPAMYIENKQYGRSTLEILEYVCRQYNPKSTHSYFQNMVTMQTKTLKGGSIQLTEEFAEGFLAMCKHYIKNGRGTLMHYGSGNKSHVVSLININNKLYMYDYQQQYCIEEQYILDTIILQSSDQKFKIHYGDKEYQGYAYINNAQDINTIFIYFPMTLDSPIYDGTMAQSLTIARYINTVKYTNKTSAQFSEYVKIINDCVTEVLTENGLAPEVNSLSNILLMKSAERFLEVCGITDEIEPQYSPQITYPIDVLRKLVDFRTRYLNDKPDEKEKEMNRLLENDYAASRPMATWDTLRDMLKYKVINIIIENVNKKLKKHGEQIMHGPQEQEGGQRRLWRGRRRRVTRRRLRAPPSTTGNPRPSRT